jgi:hypothetical protein
LKSIAHRADAAPSITSEAQRKMSEKSHNGQLHPDPVRALGFTNRITLKRLVEARKIEGKDAFDSSFCGKKKPHQDAKY